jgi:hypothetical protein
MGLVVIQVGGDVSQTNNFVSASSSLGAALFELRIDHFVMAITSAEAMLWHTVSHHRSYYRMSRVS